MSGVHISIIDPFYPSIIDVIRRSLPQGWTLSVASEPTAEARAAVVKDANVLFVMATPLSAELLRAAPKLSFVQKLGIGVDRIDTDYCRENGISVARLQGGNAIPVAEHTLMLILSSYRHLPMLDRETRAGQWDKEKVRAINRQICGKTVGIVGFGAIGRRLAQLLAGFEATVVYFDPQPASADVEKELGVRYMDLDDLVAASDIVSLHMPLTKETAGLIGPKRIAAMKPDALLVNCARGGVVDEDALTEALKEGRLFGAAIDAFSVEPPLGNPLLELENTIVTPHCAGGSVDNFAGVIARAVENTKTVLGGGSLSPDDVVV